MHRVHGKLTRYSYSLSVGYHRTLSIMLLKWELLQGSFPGSNRRKKEGVESLFERWLNDLKWYSLCREIFFVRYFSSDGHFKSTTGCYSSQAKAGVARIAKLLRAKTVSKMFSVDWVDLKVLQCLLDGLDNVPGFNVICYYWPFDQNSVN